MLKRSGGAPDALSGRLDADLADRLRAAAAAAGPARRPAGSCPPTARAVGAARPGCHQELP